MKAITEPTLKIEQKNFKAHFYVAHDGEYIPHGPHKKHELCGPAVLVKQFTPNLTEEIRYEKNAIDNLTDWLCKLVYLAARNEIDTVEFEGKKAERTEL